MTSSTSTASPFKHNFTQQVEDAKTPKSDINALVLDYLTVAGYPQAAARFSSEANLQPQQAPQDIEARHRIRTYIHKGDIQSAIAELNDLDPEILDHDKTLHFALLRLQLVELIRTCMAQPGGAGDIAPALKFAQSELGPRASENTDFLADLEKTMALLVFPHDSLEPSLAALLKPELRQDVADMVNTKILTRHGLRNTSAVHRLFMLRAYSENLVRSEGKKDLPDRIDLGLVSGESEAMSQSSGNGEPMIT